MKFEEIKFSNIEKQTKNDIGKVLAALEKMLKIEEEFVLIIKFLNDSNSSSKIKYDIVEILTKMKFKIINELENLNNQVFLIQEKLCKINNIEFQLSILEFSSTIKALNKSLLSKLEIIDKMRAIIFIDRNKH